MYPLVRKMTNRKSRGWQSKINLMTRWKRIIWIRNGIIPMNMRYILRITSLMIFCIIEWRRDTIWWMFRRWSTPKEVFFNSDGAFNICWQSLCVIGFRVGMLGGKIATVSFSINPPESVEAFRATFNGFQAAFHQSFQGLKPWARV